MEEIFECLGISGCALTLLKVLNKVTNRCVFEVFSEVHHFVFFNFDLFWSHCKLNICLEHVSIKNNRFALFHHLLELSDFFHAEFLFKGVDGFDFFFRWGFTFLDNWHTCLSFLFNLFIEWLHASFCEFKGKISLVKNEQLLSHKTGMVLLTKIVCISWSHALKVDNVASLISASDSFNLDRTSNLDFFIVAVNQFVDLDVHSLTDLDHHLMELLVGLNCLLLINGSVFSE